MRVCFVVLLGCVVLSSCGSAGGDENKKNVAPASNELNAADPKTAEPNVREPKALEPTKRTDEPTTVSEKGTDQPLWEGVRVAVFAKSGEVLGSERRGLVELAHNLGIKGEFVTLNQDTLSAYEKTRSKLVLVMLEEIRVDDSGKRFSGGIGSIRVFTEGNKLFEHAVAPLSAKEFQSFATNELHTGAFAQAGAQLKAVLQ